MNAAGQGAPGHDRVPRNAALLCRAAGRPVQRRRAQSGVDVQTLIRDRPRSSSDGWAVTAAPGRPGACRTARAIDGLAAVARARTPDLLRRGFDRGSWSERYPLAKGERRASIRRALNSSGLRVRRIERHDVRRSAADRVAPGERYDTHVSVIAGRRCDASGSTPAARKCRGGKRHAIDSYIRRATSRVLPRSSNSVFA
jgi:hypothetical protein